MSSNKKGNVDDISEKINGNNNKNVNVSKNVINYESKEQNLDF